MTPPRNCFRHGAPRRGVSVVLLAASALLLGGCPRKNGESGAPSDVGGGAAGGPGDGAGPGTPAEIGGFVEEALARGLDFRTHYLPGEQGRNFKINLYDHGTGVAVEDLDGDGDEDVYLVDQLGPNRLFRNDGGKFTDVTATAGVALDDRISVGAAFGDLDGDGDSDLYVTTTRAGNALFRNDGGMKFTDVTKEAGVELVAHSQSPLLFDIDQDGDLDLFVTNTARWTLDNFMATERYWEGAATLMDLVAAAPERNVLYRNDGGLRFTEVAEKAGLAGTTGWDGDAAPFDYDEDGDLDVFVANMFGSTRLMRNRGDGTFEDVTVATLGVVPWGSIGSRVLDADGDGRFDVYVADMHSDMWVEFTDSAQVVEQHRRYSGPEGALVELGRMKADGRKSLRDALRVPDRPLVFGSALFRNAGNGEFEDVTVKSRADTWWPWGVAVADFDMDGDEDVFLPSGMGYPWFYWRSSLLLNRGDGTFDERGERCGIEPLPEGPYATGAEGGARSFRCAAVADFDSDGRPDIIASAFNGRAHLWMNRFAPRNWIGVRLTATSAAHEAIGAVVTMKAGGRSQIRMVQPTGGYLTQSTRTLYFGLGTATAADTVDIRWPGGRRQSLSALDGGKVHRITEPR